ncbi:MAG TPA: nucleotidyltransferase domain-containing protein [Rhizomicrobium sp.]
MSITLEQTLGILRANTDLLRAKGVRHAAVFGSVARGGSRDDSDVDVLVEVDTAKHIGLFGYVAIQLALTELIGRKVDVADATTLKPIVREEIMREKVDAF